MSVPQVMLETQSTQTRDDRFQPATADAAGPRVSVIMAVRNEQEHLPACLEALRDQQPPAGGFEIIVALAPCEDRTAELLADWQHVNAAPLIVIPNPGLTAAHGLNLALRRARGEIIVRMDGHTVPAEDYLVACVDCLEGSGASLVGGSMHPVGTTPFGRSIALMLQTPFGAGGAAFHFTGPQRHVDTVYLGAWPRTVFTEVGGFDESLPCNQDDEHSRRLLARGSSILLSPSIRSTYHGRETAGALLRQYYRYGRWKPRALRRHPSALRLRALAPAALVIVLSAGALFTVCFPNLAWIGALPFVAYGAAAAGVTAAVARRTAWVLWPRLLTVTLIMHLAYGLGFLRGLIGELVTGAPAALDDDGERQRILSLYRERDSDEGRGDTAEVERALADSRREALVAACEELGQIPFEGRVLDLGCGHGNQLSELLGDGHAAEQLAGLELSPERVSAARRRLAGVDIQEGCGSRLPWPDHSFDRIVMSMVLSSIRSPKLRGDLAREAQRCLRPGGLLLIYELRVLRPFSRGLSAMPLARLTELFPEGERSHRSCTLLPPLLRRLAHRPALRRILGKLPFLRGHLALVIEAPEARSTP